jgi:aspartate aminotransferase
MATLEVSKRGQEVTASPIRKFLPLISDREAKGIKVFKLNVGDPDIRPPAIFFDQIKKIKNQNLPYAPSVGIKNHLLAWQKYYSQLGVKLDTNQILPTVGCAEAILFALLAVADIGDEVIVFEPVYASYKAFSKMAGIKLIPVTLSIESNFKLPAISEIKKKITKKTKAIVVINPDNPTGKLWTDTELNILAKLAKEYGLFIISDETYREIRFSGKVQCLLKNKNVRDNVVLLDSVSKRFSMPGARVGCIASYNSDIMGSVLKFAQARLSVGTLEQIALIPILNNSKPYIGKIVGEYKNRQKVVASGLSKIKGAIFKPSQGAFYQAVKLPIDDSEKFVKFMITEFSNNGKTVMVTPMKDFYITPGLGHQEIRIAYVLNTKDLTEAMDILKKGVEAYNQR